MLINWSRGFSIQKEMQSMVDAGMSPIDVIKTGTVNPARFFNMENDFGQVIEQYYAALILLSSNPLDDIANMQQIEGVMVRGKWLSKEFKLFTILKSVIFG